MRNNPKINRHPFVNDNIVYSAIKELNNNFKVNVDPEQFFDSCMSKYCDSTLEGDNLKLVFPVAATSSYAEVSVTISNGKANPDTFVSNDAFLQEVKRLNKKI